MSYPSDAMDPWVLKMREAEDDAARADVLLSAPVLTLLRWKPIFRDCCRRAAFDEGVAYLDALAEAMSRPRHRGTLDASTELTGSTTRLIGVVYRSERNDNG